MSRRHSLSVWTSPRVDWKKVIHVQREVERVLSQRLLGVTEWSCTGFAFGGPGSSNAANRSIHEPTANWTITLWKDHNKDLSNW